MSAKIPSATYRLQLHRGFTFRDATDLVAYLHDLGVSDCYVSPITCARPGSIHGYDVIDHRIVNPELGGEDGFRTFSNRVRESGMGLVVDIVPNHMSIADGGNEWWQDVLENGPSSPYAEFFDIDWNPPKADLANKVLLPVLGDQYGRVLENQEISVAYRDGSFDARYYEQSFPLAPRSLTGILEPALRGMVQKLGDSHLEVLELESILHSVVHLPERTERDEAKLRERRREVQVIKRRIKTLYENSRAFRSALDHSLDDLNGVKGDPSSFDRLERLLADQAYRLSFWKVASDEINYRRFFDINELAAIRMEDRAVFAATHELIFKLIGEGLVTGLRIDHVDGLLDPLQYLRRLQRGAQSALSGTEHRHLNGASERPLYVVVEKILGPREGLTRSWPVHGTTGYDLMNVLGALFVRPENQRRMREAYRRFTGVTDQFDDIVYESKRLILSTAMAGEIAVLSRRLDHISEQHRWSRDFTLNSLTAALEEVIACFPVYRSYIRRDERKASPEDRRYIEIAIARAKRRNPAISESIFEFVESVLLLQHPEALTEAQRAERREFVMRFQQLTAPVMAKGFEDTALYRYYPLASLNEVGGDPDIFGIELDAFHEWNRRRAAEWPAAMSATSTHDTKRGEDTRARISVLAEIPDEWEKAIQRWSGMNSSLRTSPGDNNGAVPDSNEEYLLYQTLVGAWPNTPMEPAQREEFVARIQAYLDKAVKEAKIHTSWMNVNEEHDRALRDFLAQVLSRREFLDDFSAFQRPIARAGMLNSLARTALKIVLPGAPDFYQGTELWDFTLVDPDNRRPVDYQLRRAMLAKIRESVRRDRRESVRQMLRDMNSGAIKMYVASRALECRREHPRLFAEGSYVPLEVVGERTSAIAFARCVDNEAALAVCGRFFMSVPEAPPLPADPAAWREGLLVLGKDLPPVSTFTEIFTGATVKAEPTPNGPALRLHEVFSLMPAAILIGKA